MAEARKRVLVVGGSGYLGQHLLQGFSRGAGSEQYALAFTHHRPIPPAELVDAVSPVLPFRVDLRTGDGFDAISTAFGQVRCSSHGCSLDHHLRSLHVNRGVTSPADISMDISLLIRVLGINPCSFEDGVRSTLEISDSS
ncbi:hypothetical protein GW17_00014568 [Ensete ventricosum]|nr:hypothetical protein GW17_00014568 [Ensete ventricosum]